ncbi:MAG TPA: alpha/beta fold hydrolase [Polyangia bacterium]|nr:alpha/beta fold hydrolase [Polyangia bacterium]
MVASAGGAWAAGPVETAILDELARDVPGGLRADHWNWLADSGGRLRILRGGAGAPGGDTLVLLHGRGHAASVWFPCWPGLAQRHRILAVDLPGFGAAERGAPPGGAPDAGAERALAFFADPVEAFLAAEVAVGPGGAGLALMGHSLGALVALELALRGRLPVRRLVLIDGMGLGPEMTLAGRLFFRLHPERLARVLGARIFGWLNPSPPTPLGRRVAALEHELLTVPRSARAAAARAFDALCPLRGPVFHRRERLGELDLPVLLLWGQHDAALPPANATGAQPSLPRARYLALAGGHSPHLEAPEEALAPVLDFLGARRDFPGD